MEPHRDSCFSFLFFSSFVLHLLCRSPLPSLLGNKARIFHIPNSAAEMHLRLQVSALTCVSQGVFHQGLKKRCSSLASENHLLDRDGNQRHGQGSATLFLLFSPGHRHRATGGSQQAGWGDRTNNAQECTMCQVPLQTHY